MSSPLMRRAGIGLVAVLVLAGGARWLSQRGAAGANTGPTAAASAQVAAPLQLAKGDLNIVQQVSLVRSVEASGSLKARQSAFVKAKVAGELRELNVREGESVRAGQKLGQIDTTELDWRLRQAEQQAQSARAQWDATERTLANNKALAGQGFISATAMDASQFAANGAHASFEAAQSAVELARKARADAVLLAPIGGQVSQRMAQPGERLAVDGRVVEIVDLTQLELEVAVAAEDVPSVRVGAVTEVRIDGLASPLRAKVQRINPSTLAGSRAVLVYLSVPSHPALRQGLFGRARIEADRLETLAVHSRALRHDQPLPSLLAIKDGRVQRVNVQIGASGEVEGEPMTALVQGPAAGTPVLAGTVGMVADGVQVSTAPQAGPAASAAVGAALAASR